MVVREWEEKKEGKEGCWWAIKGGSWKRFGTHEGYQIKRRKRTKSEIERGFKGGFQAAFLGLFCCVFGDVLLRVRGCFAGAAEG
ncbi:hypothetical protein L6452_06005 [Arctium lappa]|uniref:Uncharacterized protein n=1 Tax=Arctium lappa TaxID=4217 RepID=A0ACB9EJ10_ARCLA|nr:hypothetical protein L6452_06005 [Arctium lappa]